MKNALFLSLAALVLFSACGKDDKKANIRGEVVIPDSAFISDYSCQEVSEIVEGSRAPEKKVTYEEKGVSYEWNEGDVFVSYDVASSGTFRALNKTSSTKLSETTFSRRTNKTVWFLKDGAWDIKEYLYERKVVKEGNFTRITDYKVNGESRTNYWVTETIKLGGDSIRQIARHSQPSVLNTADRRYLKIESTCDYIAR